MSLVPRCCGCEELVSRCRCDFAANPLDRDGFVEQYERDCDERERLIAEAEVND